MRFASRKKIGVFICHCGKNIAGAVDIDEVARRTSSLPGVVCATDYKYMCSEPGQAILREKIKELGLGGIVVAACTPSLHEATFRKAVLEAGANPYCMEIANIREQCAWVHQDDKNAATAKASEIIASMVEKVAYDIPLFEESIPIVKRALVIGGGIAGMQAALDIGDAGHEVILVEREPSIGGHMAQLSETFPTLDCAQCILTPKMVGVGAHPHIHLLTYSEVREVSGYVGNFRVKIERKARGVDWEKCTGCGICMEKCPTKVEAEFERGLGKRKAIYTPFPQAVPNKPVIDRAHCLYYKKGTCRICEKNCEADAIVFDQEPEFIEEDVGAIIVATGYDLYAKESLGEYGAGEIPDVIDSLAFERLLSASGPTAGEVRRPSDGKIPRSVVFIQCAGSRDPEKHKPYCSRICCMYTTKQALLYKHAVQGGQAYIFYIDIRSGGKNYEEFVERVQSEGVIYTRGKVARVYKDGEKVIVMGVDTLLGKPVQVEADLVVLAMAMEPPATTEVLSRILKITTDANGFYTEAHPKMNPLGTTTRGIFLAGCAQAPRDIPDTVSQGSGAAGKVITIFSNEALTLDPMTVDVDEELCAGCGLCVPACPYEARILDPKRRIAVVNAALCQGCGACMTACPNGATVHRNFTKKQILKMVQTLI
ncbi:MAG: CoB--CoM heterodisulfide reductase iron-sulfur subunit A family protein [Candidatus Sumerlaeota bacterium]|nr:CoB--CoM heterodisulfide reductase iron-sulfur subunit A family protein [Candidatus Sumerlaeota bacterium]